MRRLPVLLALLAFASFGAVVACGDKEKPPLTPDTVDPMPADGAEAGTPAHPSTATPAPKTPPPG